MFVVLDFQSCSQWPLLSIKSFYFQYFLMVFKYDIILCCSFSYHSKQDFDIFIIYRDDSPLLGVGFGMLSR